MARKLSLCQVDDLWRRADDRFDVFPFDFLDFSQSALEVFDLFAESCHLVPLNRILALSDDGRLLGYRTPPHPPFALGRIIHRARWAVIRVRRHGWSSSGDYSLGLEHASGCVSKHESGGRGFAEELNAMGTRSRFLRPLSTKAYTVGSCLLGFFTDGGEF